MSLQRKSIQPLSAIHLSTILVILHALSPLISFAESAFVGQSLGCGIEAPSIAHTLLPDLKSFVHLIPVLVVQNAPAPWCVVQHISFPPVPIHTEVQNDVVHNVKRAYSIHFQQLLRFHVHFDGFAATYLFHDRLVDFRDSSVQDNPVFGEGEGEQPAQELQILILVSVKGSVDSSTHHSLLALITHHLGSTILRLLHLDCYP